MSEPRTVTVVLKNGAEYVGIITKRGRSETRMTLTNGNLNVVPTWAIAEVRS